MKRLWVLLLLMVAACAYGSPSPARLQQASSAAQALNEAVRESAGCNNPGADCGTYRAAQGNLSATPYGGGWVLESQSGASQRQNNYVPPPVYYHNYGGYNPRYWGTYPHSCGYRGGCW